MKNTRNLNGYVVLYLPDHPNAMFSDNWKGYVYEHIVIAIKMIGRDLLDNEVVHHLNGCKDDNRESNLIVLDKGHHKKLHNWIDAGCAFNPDKSVLEISRFCDNCNKPINLDTSNKNYCSPECSSLSRRKVERPSKEVLEAEIKSNKWETLAKKYNVSSNAIRKWAKSYQLI